MRRELVGEQLGNYTLVRLLGRGGFAEVYLGQHVRLDMQAAVKILHTHLADEEIAHFHREAQVIAKLVHPNIVRILDFDVKDGTPFLVLDYAPHGTLRQQHPRGKQVPLSTVVTYVNQIADALQYAHDQKLIHRDVKPENMLIGRRNEIVLSDFGIATIAHSTSSMSAQASVGTAPYMAPEQIQAHPRPASDQYALGIVVYEWLCGERPFEGSYAEIFSKHLMVQPPPLRQKLPALPPAVEQVVLTALAKDPIQRFKSVTAFAHALEQAAQGRGYYGGTTLQPHQVSSLQSKAVYPEAPSQEQAVSPAPQPALPDTPSPPQQKATDASTRKNRSAQPHITIAGLLGRTFLLLLGAIGGMGTGLSAGQSAGISEIGGIIGFFLGTIIALLIILRLD